jgi:transcriptional repressor NrdR
MLIACRKRPVSLDSLRSAAERIERDLFQEFEDEAPTSAIGERVMRELHELDTVAYVRFASVYREFETVADFASIVKEMGKPNAVGGRV